MKLALGAQDGIAVLTGSGEITAHDLDVLRAGIKKLFHSGRNQIILELLDADQLPPDIIRELSRFDLTARELSGRVILAGKNAQLKEQVRKFALPPIIECFDSREAAVQYFKPKAAPAPAAQSVAAAAKAATAHAAAPSSEDAQKAHKTEIRQKELTDLNSLRKRIVELENQNQALVQQLHSAWLTSGLTGDAALEAQVKALTDQLEEVLNQVKAQVPAGGAPAPAKAPA